MAQKKSVEGSELNAPPLDSDEDDAHRVKISITVPPQMLERMDKYRKRRGGLTRSTLFAMATDWFMDEHPIKNG
ncbi:ribbon-helix-helix domain-containing protein [Paraburkholderia tropica]|uniref:ribbon-helix-helix domain-containing protein n=1 Tax=Paraburkholderia tropica TaxID=92647 RepID=UPI002AB5E104|nr:ribbon-helix-helix domain-containing protein [Paraburkholderia tropica]